jgi:hypothetical protein
MLFKKSTFHPDYDPSYAGMYDESQRSMRISGIFQTDDGDKEVVMSTEKILKNELPRGMHMGHHFFIDADHPMNVYKFQLHAETVGQFLDLAQTVYGFPCQMGSEAPDLIDADQGFFTDFSVDKSEMYGAKIHFKRMSAGEKKIATLCRHLCNPIYMGRSDIILIDNVAMHVYASRHAKMIDKMLSMFPDKQFFITTHSVVLVGCEPDIPPHLESAHLYNLMDYKRQETEKARACKCASNDVDSEQIERCRCPNCICESENQ